MGRVRVRILSVICLVLEDQRNSHVCRFETERERKEKKVLSICERRVISFILSG